MVCLLDYNYILRNDFYTRKSLFDLYKKHVPLGIFKLKNNEDMDIIVCLLKLELAVYREKIISFFGVKVSSHNYILREVDSFIHSIFYYKIKERSFNYKLSRGNNFDFKVAKWGSALVDIWYLDLEQNYELEDLFKNLFFYANICRMLMRLHPNVCYLEFVLFGDNHGNLLKYFFHKDNFDLILFEECKSLFCRGLLSLK